MSAMISAILLKEGGLRCRSVRRDVWEVGGKIQPKFGCLGGKNIEKNIEGRLVSFLSREAYFVMEPG